jgi:hypothetical protein
MLNDMSTLMLLAMISIPLPGMVQPIQGAILGFIYLDMFHTDQWLNQLFES